MVFDESRPRASPATILRGHVDGVTCLHYLTDHAAEHSTGRYLASGDSAGYVNIWDTHIEEIVLTTRPTHLSSPVIGLQQDPVSGCVYAQHKNGILRTLGLCYNPFARDQSPSVAEDTSKLVFSDSFCPIAVLGGGVIAGPGGEDTADAIEIKDLRSGSSINSSLKLVDKSDTRGMLMCVDGFRCDTPNGPFCTKIAAGYENGSVAVWDSRGPTKPLSSVRVSSEVILSVKCSPLGGSIVIAGTAADDLCATCENEIVATGRLRGKGIGCVQWRPDGKVIATAGWDGRVRMWDGKRSNRLLRPLGSLRWHEGHAQCLAFSSRNGVLATGGRDRTIALWNVFGEDTNRTLSKGLLSDYT